MLKLCWSNLKIPTLWQHLSSYPLVQSELDFLIFLKGKVPQLFCCFWSVSADAAVVGNQRNCQKKLQIIVICDGRSTTRVNTLK